MSHDIHERTRLLLGEKQLQHLGHATVLIAGLGGVGSFAAEAIARAGVGHIILLDHDRVATSNINRQLVALHSTIDHHKVGVMARRIADINPEARVTIRCEFLRPESAATLLAEHPCDYVLDCIDSIISKAALVVTCQQSNIPVISAMGAGGRRDPNLVKIARLDRTHTCPLAREMRRHLRNLNGKMNYPVVFSTELPVKGTTHQPVANGRPRSVNGTISFLPGMFGLMMAGHVINQLLEPTTGG